MDPTTKKLIKLVEKIGFSGAAATLGHPSTQRVERWVKLQRIPDNQIGTVDKILKLDRGIK